MMKEQQESNGSSGTDRIKSVTLGAGAGMIVGAALSNPGVGMVLGAALGLTLGPLLMSKFK